MSNLATVTHLRPSQRPVERRVAEVEDGYTLLQMPCMKSLSAQI